MGESLTATAGATWHGQTLVRPGDHIANKFRVERILGAGSMGVVVSAIHLQLEWLVAIKIIRPEILSNREVVSRFLQEGRTAARLHGKHVARILDLGLSEAGLPFIVMEHLRGQELASLVAARGPIPVAEAAGYVLQVCDALAEAHGLGIIHRDLKPANLFLSYTPDSKNVVKVLDFGIAKAATAECVRTQTAVVMGSPAYMSPEQLRSAKDVDERTDIWSLGVILWELVTGKPPFTGNSFTDLCLRIAVDPLPSLPPIAGMVRGFEKVLRRTLEKDRNHRYATVGELAAALCPSAQAG